MLQLSVSTALQVPGVSQCHSNVRQQAAHLLRRRDVRRRLVDNGPHDGDGVRGGDDPAGGTLAETRKTCRGQELQVGIKI